MASECQILNILRGWLTSWDPEIYDMVGLQRPNEHLSRVKTVWDNLSEAEQEAYAAEIERIAASNKQKLVEKRKREKPVKTPPISRAAKPSA